MEKVLLDTDIGGDIDDAICLAYLLKEPQCNLIGIISYFHTLFYSFSSQRFLNPNCSVSTCPLCPCTSQAFRAASVSVIRDLCGTAFQNSP